MIIGDMDAVRPGVPTLTVALRGMANVTVEARTLGDGQAQRAVLWCGTGRAARADPAAGHAARRARQRRRAWTAPRGVGRRGQHRGGIPRPGRGGRRAAADRHRHSRLPGVVRAGDHRDRDRRAAGGRRVRRLAVCARQAEPSRPPRAGRRRGAGGADAPPAEPAAFGIQIEVHPGATGNGFAARTSSAAYDAAREAWSAAWGAPTVTIGAGGSIPLVSALAQAVPRAEYCLSAPRRVREHPRAERAGPA